VIKVFFNTTENKERFCPVFFFNIIQQPCIIRLGRERSSCKSLSRKSQKTDAEDENLIYGASCRKSSPCRQYLKIHIENCKNH
jgi:hypothetical protein